VSWPRKPIMGWPRASMLGATRRWLGPPEAPREGGEVWPGNLGIGVAASCRTVYRVAPYAAWVVWLAVLFKSFGAPRSTGGSTAGRSSWRCPRINQASAERTRLKGGLIEISLPFEAPCAALGTLWPCCQLPLQGAAPCRTGRLQRCHDHGRTSQLSGQGVLQ